MLDTCYHYVMTMVQACATCYNAIWDMKKAGSANYAVDRNTNLIALIPDHIAYHEDETYISN